jgi:hypothetical protein
MQPTLEQYVKAAYPIILVETFEPESVEAQLKLVVNKIRLDQGKESTASVREYDILSDRDILGKVLNSLTDQPKWTVLLVKNIQFQLRDKATLQGARNFLRQNKEKPGPRIVVGVCPILDEVPPEIERDVVVLRDPMPGIAEMTSIARDISAKYGERFGIGSEQVALAAEAGVGMTMSEFERACKLSLVQNGELFVPTIVEIKTQILRKSSAIELYVPGPFDSTSNIAGMTNMGFFCESVIPKKGRGILILGPPGTGKTKYAKALAAKVGLPLLIVDIGSVFGGIVGESERGMRRLIATIEAFGRCIVLLDKTVLSRINGVNCWEALRALSATA